MDSVWRQIMYTITLYNTVLSFSPFLRVFLLSALCTSKKTELGLAELSRACALALSKGLILSFQFS